MIAVTRQNAITEGELECILTRNCEGTEQLRKIEFFNREICVCALDTNSTCAKNVYRNEESYDSRSVL